MMNKGGQGLSVNAIILIVLGVVVLGVMILGFTMGWNNFSSYFSGNNVQSVVTACTTACATHSQYDFCTLKRTVKTDVTVSDVTCNTLSMDENKDTYGKYGVAKCPEVTCTPAA